LNFGAKKEHVGGVTCHLSNTWPKENPILLGRKYKAQNKILI